MILPGNLRIARQHTRGDDHGIEAAQVVDPGALAQAVQQLAGDPVRLKAMGQAARKVAAEYDRKSELERFVDYIEAVA